VLNLKLKILNIMYDKEREEEIGYNWELKKKKFTWNKNLQIKKKKFNFCFVICNL
jgi:hypothetical protein